jgi:hypothetical protein
MITDCGLKSQQDLLTKKMYVHSNGEEMVVGLIGNRKQMRRKSFFSLSILSDNSF